MRITNRRDKSMQSLEQYFINEQSDFYNYLQDIHAFKNKQTYRDYVTRLRYASRFYRLDNTVTKEYIEHVIEDLKNTIKERDRYNSLKGVGDIASGLRKFLQYIQSDYKKRLEDSVLSEENNVYHDDRITATEKEAVIKSRVGQGLFRQSLIEYWKGCSVTECQTYSLLVASHIRPWRKSDNHQRLDVFNGLLLIPNLDKLFDKGYISFDNHGRLITSDFLPLSELKILGVKQSMRLVHIEPQHLPYLQYHRDNCLL
jgi:predicted restriction endonuclease